VAVTVLPQVEIVTDAMQPDRKQADAVPVVEPAVQLLQFWCVGLESEEAEDGKEDSTAAVLPGGRHGQATPWNCSTITSNCESSAEATCPICIEAIWRRLGTLDVCAMA